MTLLRTMTDDRQRTIAHWAMELVIVVAGVLIALALQQWNEQRRAVDGMNAAIGSIHVEVRRALESLLWREAISQCHLDRAERLKAMLMTSGSHWPGLDENALLQNSLTEATGIPKVVPGIYQRPSDNFSTAAWNSALATGALEPIEPERFGKLTALYDQIQFLIANGERENRAVMTLSALGLPQELTPESRTQMIAALAELDSSRFVFNLNTRDFVQSMRQLGWNDRLEIDRWIEQDEAEDRRLGTRWRPCKKMVGNPFPSAGGS